MQSWCGVSCEVCDVFMVVCSLWVVGWNEVLYVWAVQCLEVCVVHTSCVFVWFKCGMGAVNLGCLQVCSMCVMSVMCGSMCGTHYGICGVCMKYVWSLCVLAG